MKKLISRARRRLARLIRGEPLQWERSQESRLAMWPPAKTLSERHLKNCRVVESRYRLLEFMPKHAVCAEVGILYGDFSDRILRLTEPKKLHLIDIESSAIDSAQQRFRSEISAQRVQLHLGDSAAVLPSMPDKYFDWVYIDGGHSYTQAKADLEAARPKLVQEGLIVLNDYTFFSPNEFIKYGVVEAIHDFCLEHDFEWVFFALEGRLYNDVALRKIIRS
jgi:hypothetical protein